MQTYFLRHRKKRDIVFKVCFIPGFLNVTLNVEMATPDLQQHPFEPFTDYRGQRPMCVYISNSVRRYRKFLNIKQVEKQVFNNYKRLTRIIRAGDPQICIGDPRFSWRSTDSRWRPPYLHWRPSDFRWRTHIFIGDS